MSDSASAFTQKLMEFHRRTEKLVEDIHNESVNEVERSIIEGSEITAAPGQPVRTGALRGSWSRKYLGPHTVRISTFLPYAPHVEENARGVTFANHGPHSVKLTRLGWPRIVAWVVKRFRR